MFFFYVEEEEEAAEEGRGSSNQTGLDWTGAAD